MFNPRRWPPDRFALAYLDGGKGRNPSPAWRAQPIEGSHLKGWSALKIDRNSYKIAEALQMVADAIAPVPSGEGGKLYWQEPDMPKPVLLGTLEEFAHKRVRDFAFVRLHMLIARGEIRPTNCGLYPFEWDEYATSTDVGHFELSAEEFRKLCAEIPVNVDEPDRRSPPASAPVAAGPWWQRDHDILEMAQSIGAKLHSQNKRTSNVQIAKEIERRINAIEQREGTDRQSPTWDTIRGPLTNWRFKPD